MKQSDLVALVDLDGTLADYDSAMTEAIKRDGPKPAHTRRLDRARAELARLRWVKAEWLWSA